MKVSRYGNSTTTLKNLNDTANAPSDAASDSLGSTNVLNWLIAQFAGSRRQSFRSAHPRRTLSAATRPCQALPVHILRGRKPETEIAVALV